MTLFPAYCSYINNPLFRNFPFKEFYLIGYYISFFVAISMGLSIWAVILHRYFQTLAGENILTILYNKLTPYMQILGWLCCGIAEIFVMPEVFH
jgi:hypothetical protein